MTNTKPYRSQAGGEVSDKVVGEVGSGQQGQLYLVIETELTDCHQNLETKWRILLSYQQLQGQLNLVIETELTDCHQDLETKWRMLLSYYSRVSLTWS
jgi:hypothetical protein